MLPVLASIFAIELGHLIVSLRSFLFDTTASNQTERTLFCTFSWLDKWKVLWFLLDFRQKVHVLFTTNEEYQFFQFLTL